MNNKAAVETEKAVERMRKQDIDKRGTRVFRVWEEVLVRVEQHKRKKDGIQYDGPYKILRFISTHQVELQFGNKVKQRRIE